MQFLALAGCSTEEAFQMVGLIKFIKSNLKKNTEIDW